MADPPNTDPVDRDPREAELETRSRAPAVGPWVVAVAVLALGAAAYAILALL